MLKKKPVFEIDTFTETYQWADRQQTVASNREARLTHEARLTDSG